MSEEFEAIGALTSFSVGTLDGRDAMMVIELATTPEEFERGIRRQMPVAMTPEHARELCEALLLAAKAALWAIRPAQHCGQLTPGFAKERQGAARPTRLCTAISDCALQHTPAWGVILHSAFPERVSDAAPRTHDPPTESLSRSVGSGDEGVEPGGAAL
ncbi:hypothetical protein [Microvirga roseola]|uniref:hypothetical protein n=1 Tax=Microvirga roseola TaxID=2883126 RepID=UPI001E5DB3F8|nr:hypothetical protein [Microvirga roseola]